MIMEQIVSITSQGQLTIPKEILRSFGISGGVKAVIKREDELIIVEPKSDFWSLSGSLKSAVSLNDRELKEARNQFAKKWPKR